MNVLVAGGTGFVGTHLCRELADRGHDVTALARTPEDDGAPDGVETVAGDVTDRASLTEPVADADAVVNLVALSPLFTPDGGEGMHERVHLGGTENLVDAATDAGVDRFVQQSALGADADGPTHYLRAKGRAEAVVADADLDSVVVRPSILFGDGGEFVPYTKRLKEIFAPGLPIYPLPGGGRTRFQPIWVEDFAPMLADCVDDDDRAGDTYEIGGPEVLTLRRVAELAFDAEGRDVRVVPLPMPLAKVGLTAMGATGLFPMGPDQYRSLKLDNTTADNDVESFGVDAAELRTLAAYLGVAS